MGRDGTPVGFDSENLYLEGDTLDTNGRFHADWLNMIYPRLKLSKDLLSQDGVLVISIKDAEFYNLKKSLMRFSAA